MSAPTKPVSEIFDELRHAVPVILPHKVRNENEVTKEQMTPLNRFALKITDRVGSVQFFLLIFAWTVAWCGYNILASEVPGLHWQAFDPFPAFVAYLLISNVIQILLMPLIMVGQNLQSQRSEIRAQLDFEINQKAEKEVVAILNHLQHNTDLLVQLMQHVQCQVSIEDLRLLTLEKKQVPAETAGLDVPMPKNLDA